MIRIQESDLFICNGGESEQWVETLITPELNTIYMMDCVDTVEEASDGIYNAEDGEPELDEHVWTSPLNAIKISEEICNALCKLDAANAEPLHIHLRRFLILGVVKHSAAHGI